MRRSGRSGTPRRPREWQHANKQKDRHDDQHQTADLLYQGYVRVVIPEGSSS